MDVCNTFHNVILNIIIINLCIKFGTSNVFQHFHRLFDTSKATKARQEKIGQHKLGPSGYLNLEARIVSIEKPIMHPNNKLKIIFHFIAPQNLYSWCYENIQADLFKEVPTEEDLKLGFQHGFEVTIEGRKRLSGKTKSSGDPSCTLVYKIYIV